MVRICSKLICNLFCFSLSLKYEYLILSTNTNNEVSVYDNELIHLSHFIRTSATELQIQTHDNLSNQFHKRIYICVYIYVSVQYWKANKLCFIFIHFFSTVCHFDKKNLFFQTNDYVTKIFFNSSIQFKKKKLLHFHLPFLTKRSKINSIITLSTYNNV